MRGHHVRALAGELAGLGTRVEVLEPPEVRRPPGRDRRPSSLDLYALSRRVMGMGCQVAHG